MLSVGIIDYGVGNLRSLAGAVEACGAKPTITSDKAVLNKSDCLIIPGVGAFGDGMAEIQNRGLHEALDKLVLVRKMPILGICLGAQLMATSGFEFGEFKGLGWIPGVVSKIEVPSSDIRLPHVGWNELNGQQDTPLLREIPPSALFYFVHSFQIQPEVSSHIKAYAEYGSRFAAIIQKDHIFGVQFHPEKSQRFGLALIKNFLMFVASNQS